MSALETLAERAPSFSDEDLALRFAERHAGNLRFVAAWNRWLFWNGMHWQFEETLRAWDFACSATIWMGRQRQSGRPFWRSRRCDHCRGATITQALSGERWFDCHGATIRMIP